MSVLLDRGDLPRLTGTHPIAPAPAPATSDDTLDIGLINNMPDAELQTTELQFARLLEAASGDRKLRLHFYSLPGLVRSRVARTRVNLVYRDIAALKSGNLDGLIVTGAGSSAPALHTEPWWPELAGIIDWASQHTTSAIWSCQAAHAAVLHLDGIKPRRFRQKCSGVFASAPIAAHPLTDGVRWPLRSFHSRVDDLDERDLVASGYGVLTRTSGAGVDLFIKPFESLFVFFQGHPEHDPSALRSEYLRDVSRYLTGRQDHYPETPGGYFDLDTASALAELRERALKRRDPAYAAECRTILVNATFTFERRAAARIIFRNWLGMLAEQKMARAQSS